MDALTLSRINTGVVVLAVGGVAGHLLLPFSPGAPRTHSVGFVALMLVVGAVRGWREARLRERPPGGAGTLALAAAFAAASLAVALAGYWVVHGRG